MSSQLRATVRLQKVLEGKQGRTLHLSIKTAQRSGIKLEITITMLGEFEAGKSSIVAQRVTRSECLRVECTTTATARRG